uniref:Ricin B lectin domain-containing protein n=1 Tax=Branchiostoma floridae TaxID=7739 RepID=C3Y894_BRAFL|eukprot:XP_002607321.1 hypothetical protein BRAFLDRAFT_69735 [Branchiostoma floridae]
MPRFEYIRRSMIESRERFARFRREEDSRRPREPQPEVVTVARRSTFTGTTAGLRLVAAIHFSWAEALQTDIIIVFKTGELESRLNGYRIDVSGGSAYNSASIINYPENNAVNQKWYFRDDGSIESGLGKQWVLDVQGADTNAGTKVILYERKDGGPSINQQFDVVPYVPATSAICSELNDYAIDVRQANAANSTEIISYPCHGGTNQGWTFEKNGSIVSGMGSTWVLDDAAGGGAGTNVILYTWHGGKNQQWYISTE